MRDDGKSKGIAFVKFGLKSAFNKACELNGTEQFGRPISVEQSQGKKNNNDGGFRNNNRGDSRQGGFNQNKFQGSQGQANITTSTLFLGGLSYNSTV